MNTTHSGGPDALFGLEAAAADVVERIVDALCHFAGEAPALHELESWIRDDASVVEVGERGERREEWLARIAERAARRNLDALGHFVEIHGRELLTVGDEFACSVLGVTVRDTSAGSVVRTGTARVEIVMRRFRGRLRVTRLMIGPADLPL